MPRYKVTIELTSVREVTREIDALDDYDAVTSIVDWHKSNDEEVTHWVSTEINESTEDM